MSEEKLLLAYTLKGFLLKRGEQANTFKRSYWFTNTKYDYTAQENWDLYYATYSFKMEDAIEKLEYFIKTNK